MALSNIFREPRREIVETGVGLFILFVVGVPLGVADYYFALWFRDLTGGDNFGCPLFLGIFFPLPVAFIMYVLVEALHSVGGLRLRPKRR